MPLSISPPHRVPPRQLQHLPAGLRAWGRELGFAEVAVSRLQLEHDQRHLAEWLAAGHHGDMAYMARDPAQRAQPARLRPGTVSVISARMDYWTDAAAADRVLADGSLGYVARYALGRDYHKTLRGRLLRLAARVEQAVGPYGYRVLADSAPALEKAMARDAGLGWIGKNSLLLHRHAGSYFLLGEIYTDLPLPPSTEQQRNLCGSCTSCIEACPTRAILAPYRLDARRCISYLTIEHRGPIPLALREAIGNRIFGCDDCQLACPWNRYAQRAALPDFETRHGLDAPSLIELFAWHEADYLRRTEGMALRRGGFINWSRNLAVALGNAPSTPEVIAALWSRREDPSELVREHVAWALRRHDAAGRS